MTLAGVMTTHDQLCGKQVHTRRDSSSASADSVCSCSTAVPSWDQDIVAEVSTVPQRSWARAETRWPSILLIRQSLRVSPVTFVPSWLLFHDHGVLGVLSMSVTMGRTDREG